MTKTNSFFHRLLRLLVVVGVLPLFIIGLLTYGFSRELFLEQYSRQALARVNGVAESLDRLVEEYGNIIGTLAEDAGIREAIAGGLEERRADIEQRIHLLLAGHTFKPSVYVLDRQGRLSFGTGELPAVYNPVRQSGWGIFRAAHEDGPQPKVYAHRHEAAGGRVVTLSLIRPLADERGEVIGYVIADIYRDDLERMLLQEDMLFSTSYLVLDRYGFTVLHTARPELEGTLDRIGYRKKMAESEEQVRTGRDEGGEHILFFAESGRTGLSVIGRTPYGVVQQSTSYIRILFASAAVISLLASLAFAYGMAKRMSTPIIELVKGMKRVSRGDFSTRVSAAGRDEFGLLGNGFNQMTERIEKLLQSVKEEQRRFRIAESKALQAQINPHFIYNTLDLIKWSAKMNETAQVNTIVTQLGRLLRGVIHVGREKVSVREEMELVDSYMNIQKIRFSDRLFFHSRIDPDIMEATIPRFTIHPLVENAIVHGFENKNGKMFLVVSGYRQDGNLVFEIIDNGIGMTPETIGRVFTEQNGESTGILNVHKRIQLYYGESYGIRISSEPGTGSVVTVVMPRQGVMPKQGGEPDAESRGH
jgi:two-component system sensor histidine kinase YesM